MIKFLLKSLWLTTLCCAVVSCSKQNIPDMPGTSSGDTDRGIATIDRSLLAAVGGGFIIRINTEGAWQASSSENWCVLSRTSGTGNGTISGYLKPNTGSERNAVIAITAGTTKSVLPVKQTAGDGSTSQPDPEPNPNPPTERPSGYAGRIEIPALKGGDMNIFHTWTTQENGKECITYSYEYDCAKKHVRWVAFTFDNYTSQSKVKRSNAWQEDPTIPTRYRTGKNDYKGYTRGHLVASGDRVYSTAANRQTFYMSNMSPQQAEGFNSGGGIWNNLEDKVQAWGRISNPSDTLYVVKGGTIDKSEDIRAYTNTGIVVPKYYFMAVLSYKNNQYKGMAFYVEHAYSKSKTLRNYAISIRELEQKTGINFFHNLDDVIEKRVEENFDPADWSL